MKYACMFQHRSIAPLRLWCRVLHVSRSGFYAAMKRQPGVQGRRREELSRAIGVEFDASRRTYGSRRMTIQLRRNGMTICRNTTARLMQALGLSGRKKRRFVPKTTDSRHDRPVAPNRLNRAFNTDRVNRKWAADITFIPTRTGWLYLAAVIDLCSRRIVGWNMADHLQSELVRDALKMAIDLRKPQAGLLHHSDRGSQYASRSLQAMLSQHQLLSSMSRPGNCYDNAVMESFFATLKTELVNSADYATHEEAKRSIFEYIEVFYNRQRLHSSLGYKSPQMFEKSLECPK